LPNQIAEARDKGDLSENAEYDAAKDAQGTSKQRLLTGGPDSVARLIDETKIDTSSVSILSKVTIKNKRITPQLRTCWSVKKSGLKSGKDFPPSHRLARLVGQRKKETV